MGRARLDLEERFGWRRCTDGNVTLWVAGHVYCLDDRRLAKALKSHGPSPDAATLGRWIEGLSGHFAMAAKGHRPLIPIAPEMRSCGNWRKTIGRPC